MARIDKYVRRAKILAKKSPIIYKLGALAIKKGTIKGEGFNCLKNNPLLDKEYSFYSRHAECAALINAKIPCDLLLVVRIKKSGGLGMAKPCSKCMDFMRDHGVRKVIYSNKEGFIEELKINE